MTLNRLRFRTVAGIAAAALALPLAAATPGPASRPASAGWGEPHLSVVPRTAEEAVRVAAVTVPPTDFAAPEAFEARPAGAATRYDARTRAPVSLPSANLDPSRRMDFALGEALFEKLWVAAPTATTASDGLGPLFNARGCAACHDGGGRGRPPAGHGDTSISIVLRISLPDGAPDPVYGRQLQERSVAGLTAEGRQQVVYSSVPVILGDGSVIELRKPAYSVARAAHGPLAPDAGLSPRMAPPLGGLGLLEAVPEADILALADPEDADGDGISGRANRVWSLEYGQWMLGRFGLRAAQPTLAQQISDAFATDIGISTPIHPAHWGDCTAAEPSCRDAPHGGTGNDEGLEAPSAVVDLATVYVRNIAVPARRDVGTPQVLEGKQVFHDVGCAACHQPKFVTHRLVDRPEQSYQLIWPYSDLLLHDMGEGLADGHPEAGVTAREWRTAPLWGIGLATSDGGQAHFLHDGRARTLLEAILWHGGEARASREAVRTLPAAERAALITFLESL